MPQQQKDRITDGSLIAFGENPNGPTTITPNGIAHDRGEGANHQYMAPGHNGPRWEMPTPEVTVFGNYNAGSGAISTSPTRRTPGNKNRTGS